jgi:hypothetical protein
LLIFLSIGICTEVFPKIKAYFYVTFYILKKYKKIKIWKRGTPCFIIFCEKKGKEFSQKFKKLIISVLFKGKEFYKVKRKEVE